MHASVGAVKAALHRGRTRLKAINLEAPARVSTQLVDRFMAALAANDIGALRALCREDVTIELVGGATFDGFQQGKMVFEHAHFVMPSLGFGEAPRWETAQFQGEAIVLGMRTVGGQEGLNEVWRLIEGEGGIAHVRLYCFCPETLHAIAQELGSKALSRPYRSPG